MSQYSVEEAVEISNRITGVAIILVGAAVTFLIGIVLIKVLWAWTVPDLFPAAVDQGLIARELTWLAAAKLAILIALLVSTGSLITGRWGRKWI